MDHCSPQLRPAPVKDSWFGYLTFTLAILSGCKWANYKYIIYLSEEDGEGYWWSMKPAPPPPPEEAKPPAPDDCPTIVEETPKPTEEPAPPLPPPPSPEEEKPKKKGKMDEPIPPKNSEVDDFCFYSTKAPLPTSATITIIDPLSISKKKVHAELNFRRWKHGKPPKNVILTPSRNYLNYRFRDMEFYVPPPPPPPKRPQRIRPQFFED